jgi:hypothetical protein
MTQRKIGRRKAMTLIGAAGAAAAFGCSNSVTSPSAAATTTTAPTSSNAACAVTPSETAGPFPSVTSLIRSDIREDRQGIPLTLTIKVVNSNSACAPVAGGDVEIWHADVAGNYSEYAAERSKTYLRGVQTTVAEAVNNAVYASSVYASRGVNPTANASDGIFADSLASELVTPVGSAASGYTATFQVGIAA